MVQQEFILKNKSTHRIRNKKAPRFFTFTIFSPAYRILDINETVGSFTRPKLYVYMTDSR